MKVVRSVEEAEREKPWGIMAIGVFDGMHHGHKEIFARARELARKTGNIFSVMTFHPHPDVVLRKVPELKLIYSLEERLRFFEKEGVEKVIVIPFNEEFSRIGPEEFVERILLGKLDVKGAVVGENFRFGRDAAGNAWTLRELLEKHGVPVIVVERQKINGEAVSSSRIREALRKGDLQKVKRMLGRDFSVRGLVVRGRGLARKLGFPTVNLKPEIELALKPGVYAGYVEIEKRLYPAVIHWGARPTVGDREQILEFHVIREGVEVRPGQEITVSFFHRIRDIRAFPDVQALKNAIEKDIKAAIRVLDLK